MIKNLEARLSQTRPGAISPIAAAGRSKVGQIVRVRHDSKVFNTQPQRNFEIEIPKPSSITKYKEQAPDF
jgi:hypothetical protein